MERTRVSRVTVGEGEVNGDGDVDLTTTEDVLQERVLPLDFEVDQLERAFLLLHRVLSRPFFELLKSHGFDRVQNLVFAVCVRPKELNFDAALDVVLAEVRGADLHLVPLEGATLRPFDLGLVHWRELARTQVPVDDEEAQS